MLLFIVTKNLYGIVVNYRYKTNNVKALASFEMGL
jgi:hypothetical protein